MAEIIAQKPTSFEATLETATVHFNDEERFGIDARFILEFLSHIKATSIKVYPPVSETDRRTFWIADGVTYVVMPIERPTD
ncbi:MAG TPA: hypothetical protein PKZ07_18600 [Sedimentisphaerales bacterium]|nr:hypothetical protein [Sedimentisphaerales bacterium]